MELKGVHREIDSLDTSKTIQQNHIPLKLIKANRDIFSEFIMHNFNEGISTARFPNILEGLNQSLSKSLELIKMITDVRVFTCNL